MTNATDDTPMTLEEFVRARYQPAPDDSFYKAWGYEQWLIKTVKQNLAGLMILERPAWRQYLLSFYIDPADPVGSLVGKPLVRATRIIRRFLSADVAVGKIGVLLGDSGLIFWLAPCNAIFRAIFDHIPDSAFEPVDETFTSLERVKELTAWDTIENGLSAEERFITGLDKTTYEGEVIRPDQVYYCSKAWSGAIGYDDYSYDLFPANQTKGGKWRKAPGSKAIRVRGVGTADLEVIRIVQ